MGSSSHFQLICIKKRKLFAFSFFVVTLQSHAKLRSANVCLSCTFVVDHSQCSRCTVLFGEEYQKQQSQYIRQDHDQILITAGHLQYLYQTVSTGSGKSEQQTRSQSRQDTPVAEDQCRNSQITVTYINTGGKVCGKWNTRNQIPASPDNAPQIIMAARRICPTCLPAASTAWGLSPQARRCMPKRVLYITNHATKATTTITSSKGYRLVNTAPSTGM